MSFAGVAFALFALVSPCQQPEPGHQPQPGAAQQPAAQQPEDNKPRESKRILGIIPNYKTSPTLQNYEPLPSREKFKLASHDAFYPGTIALAVLFGAEGQLTNAKRSFGQGDYGFYSNSM